MSLNIMIIIPCMYLGLKIINPMLLLNCTMVVMFPPIPSDLVHFQSWRCPLFRIFGGYPPVIIHLKNGFSMENMENHGKSGFHEINNLFYHHLWKPQIFLFP